MQYSFTCPTEGCNFSVKVMAKDDDWALEKIIETISFHNKQSHPNLPLITHEQIKNILLSGVKKDKSISSLNMCTPRRVGGHHA